MIERQGLLELLFYQVDILLPFGKIKGCIKIASVLHEIIDARAIRARRRLVEDLIIYQEL